MFKKIDIKKFGLYKDFTWGGLPESSERGWQRDWECSDYSGWRRLADWRLGFGLG